MGLTADQKKVLVHSWKTLGENTDTLIANGTTMFSTLFEAYPDTRKSFPHFKGVSDDLMKSGVGRAHGMAVFSGLGAIISCINDTDCMDGLILKLARNHAERKIGASRFQQMRDVFGKVLDKAMGGKAPEDVKMAWDAFFAMMQEVLAAEEKKH